MSSSEGLPKMQYRRLGRSGLKVSVLGLGGWLTYGGHVQDNLTADIMKAAYDAGINFFDCAETYGDGKSEIVMGEVIKKFGWKRNDIVVTTKIYFGKFGGDNPVNNVGLSRKHIVEGVNASLKRLQLDYVDVIYAHRPDRETPLEETVRAFNHIIDKGQAFYWGTSEWTGQEISAAAGIANRLGLIGPIVEQPEYNMLEREKVEKDYALLYDSPSSTSGSIGLGLTTFCPLRVGVLTGKYNDKIPEGSRLAGDGKWVTGVREGHVGTDEWNAEIAKVRKLQTVAEKLGCDVAALAIAWILKNPNVSCAITGASRVEQVHKNVRALDVVPKLTDEVLEEIEEILANKPAALELRAT